MKVHKLAIACAAVAVAVSGCGSSDESLAAGTKTTSDYPDRIDLGGGYQLSLTLPDGAAVAQSEGDGLIMMWKDRDLSGLSNDELLELMGTSTTDDVAAAEVSGLYFALVPCANADEFRNEDDTVDGVSPLNGQPMSYRTVDLADELAKQSGDAGSPATGLEDFNGGAFALTLGGTPCQALIMSIVQPKGAPASPPMDLPHQVLVEGEGVLTGPE